MTDEKKDKTESITPLTSSGLAESKKTIEAGNDAVADKSADGKVVVKKEEKEDTVEKGVVEGKSDKKEKTEKKVDEDKTTDIKVAVGGEEKEEKTKSKLAGADDIELPDDIKKKLEDRKNTKGKKLIKRKKKGAKKRVEVGKVFIKASYNNTIVNITDLNGNTISWASAGVAGFKGPKKATSYAAQIITKIACMKAKEDYGLREVSIFVRGIGTGRESAVRSVNANNLLVTSIKDITPVPHNGCRPKKPRRV